MRIVSCKNLVRYDIILILQELSNWYERWSVHEDNRSFEMPDYCERSVFEALVNALIHRDYLINGSEVHVDMFNDRLVGCRKQLVSLFRYRQIE